MKHQNGRAPLRLSSNVLWFLAAIVSFFVLFEALILFADSRAKREVKGEATAAFPIVVMTPGRAQVVLKGDLDRFISTNPDYSFLIPADKTEEYKFQIVTNTRATQPAMNFESGLSIPWDARFTVQEVSPGKQAFAVDAPFDDDAVNVGWYEASNREIFPKYHKLYFGPALALPIVLFALLVTSVSWMVGILIVRRVRRRKRYRAKA